MSDSDAKTLGRLEDYVASARKALDEISLWHRVATSALDDLQAQLERGKAELKTQATPAAGGGSRKRRQEAEEEAAAAAETSQASTGGVRRSAARRAGAGAAEQPVRKRARANSVEDLVARKALLKAVEVGRLNDVQHFLAIVDPNCNDPKGNTPLHLAAKHCRQRILQVLLEEGADVRATNHSQQTALHVAALADTKGSCCELLLRAAEDVGKETLDVQDKTKRTALHYAATKGNAEAVKLLLGFGADSSITNIKGATALDVASTPEVQRLLREPLEHRIPIIYR